MKLTRLPFLKLACSIVKVIKRLLIGGVVECSTQDSVLFLLLVDSVEHRLSKGVSLFPISLKTKKLPAFFPFSSQKLLQPCLMLKVSDDLLNARSIAHDLSHLSLKTILRHSFSRRFELANSFGRSCNKIS